MVVAKAPLRRGFSAVARGFPVRMGGEALQDDGLLQVDAAFGELADRPHPARQAEREDRP